MADVSLPRLTVTREQAEQIAWHSTESPWGKGCAIRLPERPTMPMWRLKPGALNTATEDLVEEAEPRPIPEGTRVEVGFDELAHTAFTSWRPVATATVAKIEHVLHAGIPWTEGANHYLVTLTDITPPPAGATPAS